MCAGTVYTARKVVVTCGPWAKPLLEAECGLSLPLQVWQTTVAYFKPAAGVPDAAARLAALPVLIDYASVPLWTSTSGCSCVVCWCRRVRWFVVGGAPANVATTHDPCSGGSVGSCRARVPPAGVLVPLQRVPGVDQVCCASRRACDS